jgi:hypothetical protein
LKENNVLANEAYLMERVEIAQDVLARIERGELNCQRGRYCRATQEVFDRDAQRCIGETPPELAQYLTNHCGVCARGALLIGWLGTRKQWIHSRDKDVGKVNPFYPHFDRDGVDVVLIPHFTRRELLAIEAIFELWHADIIEQVCGDNPHNSPSDRLKATMEYIVEHGGAFAPAYDESFRVYACNNLGF